MFNFLWSRNKELEPKKSEEKTYFICQTCGHLIDQWHIAICEYLYADYQSSEPIYFCKDHKPKWDIKEEYRGLSLNYLPTGNIVTKYFIKKVECDENGQILEKNG